MPKTDPPITSLERHRAAQREAKTATRRSKASSRALLDVLKAAHELGAEPKTAPRRDTARTVRFTPYSTQDER